jgi:NADH-quinone oxidoreductase subunit F
MSGSSAIIVIDDSVDIVERAGESQSEFYAHESCGQCTPCREGSLWMSKTLHRLTHGEGRKQDADYLREDRGQHSRRSHHLRVWRSVLVAGAKLSSRKFKDEFVAKGAADEERRAKEAATGKKELAVAPH